MHVSVVTPLWGVAYGFLVHPVEKQFIKSGSKEALNIGNQSGRMQCEAMHELDAVAVCVSKPSQARHT